MGPYDWLADLLPSDGVIVDMACGSGPLATRVGGRWIGLDRSPAELRRAARVAPGRVAVASADSAPLHDGVADAVVCSMALMLFDDPPRPSPRWPACCGPTGDSPRWSQPRRR